MQGSGEMGCMGCVMGDEPGCGSHEYYGMDLGFLGSHQMFFIQFVFKDD